jgi:hypothetical protein
VRSAKGALVVTVEMDSVCVEARLSAGEIGCPSCGVGVLGGWGHARARRVVGLAGRVRPRRSRCRGCLVTHVLLPVSLLLRRAYLAEWIWAALVARAVPGGPGFRGIAAGLGVPGSTVRGWLRRMAGRLGAVRVHFVQATVVAGVDVRLPGAAGSGWADVVAAVEAARVAIVGRFGGSVSGASAAVAGSGGRLLSPGWPGFSVGADATPVDSAAMSWGAGSSRW